MSILACCSSTQSQSEKISSAKSPAQISLIVLGVLLIIAGITATSLLYPQTGNIALSSLAGTVIGIALIAIGSVCKARPNPQPEKTASETTIKQPEQKQSENAKLEGQPKKQVIDQKKEDAAAKAGTFSLQGPLVQLTNGAKNLIQVCRITRGEQSTQVLTYGKLEEGCISGDKAPAILAFLQETDNSDLLLRASLHDIVRPSQRPRQILVTESSSASMLGIKVYYEGFAVLYAFSWGTELLVDSHGQRYLPLQYKDLEC